MISKATLPKQLQQVRQYAQELQDQGFVSYPWEYEEISSALFAVCEAAEAELKACETTFLDQDQMWEIQRLMGDNSPLSDLGRGAVEAIYIFAQNVDMELAELTLQAEKAQELIVSLQSRINAQYSPPKFGEEGYADWAAERENREWQEQKRKTAKEGA